MLTDDGATRGRLLNESSTRAFSALQARALGSLSRLRALGLLAFAILAAVFAALGDSASRFLLLPLFAYGAASFLAVRWAQRGRERSQRLVAVSPALDLVFVFALLWFAGGAQSGADRAVGLFALLVGLSALSLRERVVAVTAAAAAVLATVLKLRAGASGASIAGGALVLAFVAMAASAVVREIERVLARLVVNEVSHEELRRAQDEAETLTHLLVHDMKGPLTGLIGLAEVVASELTGRLQTDVRMIEQQGRRLQGMVGDLLAIARMERGVLGAAPEPVDLAALLLSLANAYSVNARQAGAQIRAEVETGLCAVLHREMVHRFFDNLVLNALDFVRPGGRIEVTARQDGAELVLAVRNTGDPVPPEARARLFQKHAVSRGASRGKHNLGLGLYLCRLVAVAHDGTIALVEEPGWSASFVARLPVEARRLAFEAEPVNRAGNA